MLRIISILSIIFINCMSASVQALELPRDRGLTGIWKLDNPDNDILIGSLILEKNQFNIILVEQNCSKYQTEGKVKKKDNNKWILIDDNDHTYTYNMTYQPNKNSTLLRLIDTVNKKQMIFSPSSISELNNKVKKSCNLKDLFAESINK